MEFWDADPQSWDTLVLGGELLPGLVKLTGEVGIRLQTSQSPGIEGEALQYNGAKLATLRITLRLWTQEHWDEWERLLPILRPPPTKGIPKPLDCAHPALRAYGIKSLLVETIQLPNPVGDGIWEIEMEARQFGPLRRQQNVSTSLKSSQQAPPLTSLPTAAGPATPAPSASETEP